MRRIIERVVTVVTTTTWTISWKDDSPLSKPEVDSVTETSPTPEQTTSTLPRELQEADETKKESTLTSKADEPPTKSQS